MSISSAILRNRFALNKIKIASVSPAHFSSQPKEEIVIPNRIPRGPTDILRALESTIGRDPTASHYKYHDDPYLIPTSNAGKRAFAMAQEAGKKAALWVRTQHADLFKHREADPPVDMFFPKMVYNENSDVKEEDLIKTINEAMLQDAVLIHKLLKDKGVNISQNTLQSFLELLCFFNGEEPISEEFIEEKWFRQSTKLKEKRKKTWKDGALAEEIFISIDKPSPETYCAIIQGMAKYNQVERAHQLFLEAQEKGHILSTDTYNSLISVASFLKEGHDMRWTFVMELLTGMKHAKLKPNLGTLNAVLETLSTMGSYKNVRETILKTLAEFKALGIEPSLASWYYVLITFCKERGPISHVLVDIVNLLENKELAIKDLKDTYFFVTAMDVCHNHLCDKDLAKRVDKLLHYKNNYNLLGDSYKESIYYRHYVTLLSKTEPINEFMENVYHLLVPHIYVPEPGVMAEILKTIEANNAIEYIPKLWSDMVVFDHSSRENLLNSLLGMMVHNEPTKKELVQQFGDVAWGIYDKVETQNENRTIKLSFTGDMLGNILTVLVRAGDMEKASIVMDKLDKEQNKIVGFPQEEALSLFVDGCIQEKMPTRAIKCIQYCADCGFENVSDLAKRLNDSLTLDETFLAKLSGIAGRDVLKKRMVKTSSKSVKTS